jgi:[acyl-carrier-protein] S-malonyltransferase
VIGSVVDTAIPRERLDARVRELRSGRLAGRLPAVGSKEDRQFLRWTAQVLLTEELCRVESARLGQGQEPGRETTPRPLTQVESLHLGSINAAAWARSSAMSELYDLVTESAPSLAPQLDTRTWYRVTHAVAATPIEAATAPETSLGWTTLDDLPAPLAAELRARPSGTRVGPVRTGLGWHFATVTATEVRPTVPAPRPDADAPDPARLAAFNRWLDERRSVLVTNAHGFEHPGDPGQPDNTHRH